MQMVDHERTWTRQGPWPALAAIAALLALCLWLVSRASSLAGGAFTYPLDDAYIHLAVAKNLAAHGVWGVTQHGFTFANSSLAWPLLLAALARAGVGEPAALSL